MPTSEEEEQTFKKRRGTTEKGKEYENLYVAYLILKLTLDDKVEEFFLSSNDEKFGDFDDVVVKIKFKDRTETYAIQLKHHMTKHFIETTDLTAKPRNKYIIEKYYKTFNDTPKLKDDVTMILFTNNPLGQDIKEGKEFDLDKMKIYSVPGTANQLLNTSTEHPCCHTFKINQADSSEASKAYDRFFENFYLYTAQFDVTQLENKICEMLKENFMCEETVDVFRLYKDFICKWSEEEEDKYKLNKEFMMRFITLCVLSPCVKSLEFDGVKSLESDDAKSVHERETIFREVVSKFNVTMIDEGNYDKIKHLWSDATNESTNLTEAGKISSKYLPFLEKIKVKKNELMWLQGKCPLVVQECPQVHSTFKIFCENLIILKDPTKAFDESSEIISGQKTFQKLSDLKGEPELYEKILTTFTYSIEGQKETALKHLLEICQETESLIASDQVVEMLKDPLPIGNQKEVLPPGHIKRRLTKILIDFKFLKRGREKRVVLVDGVVDCKKFKKLLGSEKIKEITGINNTDLVELPDRQHIYICKKDISREVFTKYPEMEIHHFRYVNNQCLEWIRSQNFRSEKHFKDLNHFRLRDESRDHTLRQSELFSSNEQDINIICSEPGMGKSTLMKSLKENSSSENWTIAICARKHFSHFRKNGADVEKFKEYILDYKEYSNFEREVFKSMLDGNRIQVIWDGLDEVSDKTLDEILTLVQNLAERGVQQCVTSRNHMKTKLESRLGRLSRNIKPFNEEELQKYIEERLPRPADESNLILSKIKKYIIHIPKNKILGIPLQIFMLTELFSIDEEKYSQLLDNNDNNFTLLDLYQHFVDKKFEVFYQEKRNVDFSVEANIEKYEPKKEKKINCYEIVAARYYLKNLPRVTNNDENVNPQLKKFSQEIEQKGDSVGFICQMTSDGVVEFSHNSYGEYFAALYLLKTCRCKVRHKQFMSNNRYNNIRFFLNLMLCKAYKGFVAVLYKNSTLLDNCTDEQLNERDDIRREILEVACAYSKNYAYPKNKSILHDGRFLRNWVVYRGYSGDLNYTQISPTFRSNTSINDIRYKKLFLFLPFLILLSEEYRFDQEYLNTMILYYAIRFDFVVIFDYVEYWPSTKEIYKSINFGNILALAMYYRSHCILERLFFDDRSYQVLYSVSYLALTPLQLDEIFADVLSNVNISLDEPDSEGQFLTHYASRNNLHKTLKVLNTKKAKWDAFDAKDRCAIHYACMTGNVETLELLIDFGCDIDFPDGKDYLPIHYTCEYDTTELTKVLVEKGAKLDAPDRHKRYPIHYMCEKGNTEMVKLMVKKGAEVNIPDTNGKYPIHYMCQSGDVDVVEFLVTKGAKLEAVNGQLPIHYACENYFRDFKIVQFLVEKGQSVNTPDTKGKLPIHYMCEQGATNIVELLINIDKSVINVEDANGKCPIHYACEGGRSEVLNLLLKNGATVNVLNRDRELPIHCAVKSRSADAVKELVTSGVNVNVLDGIGLLPLHYACIRADVDLVKLLLDQGAQGDLPDLYGNLPLHYACLNAKSGLPIISLLLEKDLDVNVRNAIGHLPIHFACEPSCRTASNFGYHSLGFPLWKGIDESVVKFLVERGARLDIADANGRFPMHLVCRQNKPELVKLLAEKGADVNVSDQCGRLPIHYACEWDVHSDEIVKFLTENGASVNVRDVNGMLPIHEACERGSLSTVVLLMAHGADVNGRLIREYARKNYFHRQEILEFLEIFGNTS